MESKYYTPVEPKVCPKLIISRDAPVLKIMTLITTHVYSFHSWRIPGSTRTEGSVKFCHFSRCLSKLAYPMNKIFTHFHSLTRSAAPQSSYISNVSSFKKSFMFCLLYEMYLNTGNNLFFCMLLAFDMPCNLFAF